MYCQKNDLINEKKKPENYNSIKSILVDEQNPQASPSMT